MDYSWSGEGGGGLFVVWGREMDYSGGGGLFGCEEGKEVVYSCCGRRGWIIHGVGRKVDYS